ncbi:MAG: head GIN domain-containing protein [Bacteroidota bacterium]
MKRTILAAGLIACSIMSAACNVGDCISGSGVVISQERTMAPFESITTDGSMRLVITQDTVQSLRLEGEDNILPLIRTTVTDGRLTISSDRCYSSQSEITVYASMKQIRGLRISGSGDIRSTNTLSGDRLELGIEGSGNITLALSMATLTSDIDGSGNIHLTGSAPNQRISISGSGDIDASGLASDTSTIAINGSGNARVDVAKYFDVNISGSGDIYYKGTPAMTINISGAGKLIKI